MRSTHPSRMRTTMKWNPEAICAEGRQRPSATMKPLIDLVASMPPVPELSKEFSFSGDPQAGQPLSRAIIGGLRGIGSGSMCWRENSLITFCRVLRSIYHGHWAKRGDPGGCRGDRIQPVGHLDRGRRVVSAIM